MPFKSIISKYPVIHSIHSIPSMKVEFHLTQGCDIYPKGIALFRAGESGWDLVIPMPRPVPTRQEYEIVLPLRKVLRMRPGEMMFTWAQPGQYLLKLHQHDMFAVRQMETHEVDRLLALRKSSDPNGNDPRIKNRESQESVRQTRVPKQTGGARFPLLKPDPVNATCGTQDENGNVRMTQNREAKQREPDVEIEHAPWWPEYVKTRTPRGEESPMKQPWSRVRAHRPWWKKTNT